MFWEGREPNLRDLYLRVSELEKRVVGVENRVISQSSQVAFENLLDNTDFVFSEQQYRNFPILFTNVLALWYFQDINDPRQPVVVNQTMLESPMSIRSSDHAMPRPLVVWDLNSGLVRFGRCRLLSLFYQNWFQLGNVIFFRASLLWTPRRFLFSTVSNDEILASSDLEVNERVVVRGSSLPPELSFNGSYYVHSVSATGVKLKESQSSSSFIPLTSGSSYNGELLVKPKTPFTLRFFLFENYNGHIIKSSTISLRVFRVGSGGSFVRRYVAEFELMNGQRFTSVVGSWTTGDNQIDTVSNPNVGLDLNNYAVVVLPKISLVSRVSLYRECNGEWRFLGNFIPPVSQIEDFGGGVLCSAPTELKYEVKQEFVITEEDLDESRVFEVRGSFVYPSSLKQPLVEVGFGVETDENCFKRTLGIDRIGVGFGLGRWSPSSRDLLVQGSMTYPSSPPPNSGGSGGSSFPIPGGGSSCVWAYHEVLTAEGKKVLRDLKLGNSLWSGWGWTVVKGVRLDRAVTKGIRLHGVDSWICVTDSHSFVSRRGFLYQAKDLKVGDVLFGFKEGKAIHFIIEEIIDLGEEDVVMLDLEPQKTFVVLVDDVQILCHNYKPVITVNEA